MSFLKFFSGPTPEKLEKKGDALFKAGLWGQAKLEYESALVKAEKGSDLSPDWEAQLSGKIAETKEALAKAHQKSAEDFIEGGYYDDARPLISLALEMPHNAPAYYDKVSRIYAAQGNETEAARFRSIAKVAAAG